MEGYSIGTEKRNSAHRTRTTLKSKIWLKREVVTLISFFAKEATKSYFIYLHAQKLSEKKLERVLHIRFFIGSNLNC